MNIVRFAPLIFGEYKYERTKELLITKYIFFALTALCLFTGVDCKGEPPVVPPMPKLSLTLVSAEQRQVQIKLATTVTPAHCIVERDTMILFDSVLTQHEILLTDSTVVSGEQYTYKAHVLNSDQDTALLQVTTPEADSTSHEIVWEIDTLGTWQSEAYDVWGTSPQNVYVAGFFYDPDSVTAGTNIMHWDGKKWKPENFWEGGISAIYGFSENDIWVGGDWGDVNPNPLLGHWNGTKWEKIILGFEGWIRGLWGTSSNNLYAVGGNGKIFHYDGISWTQMISGTSINLWDIWGFSNNAIYACGYDESTGFGVLLFYDGINWNKLYERNNTDAAEPNGQTLTVWGYDTSHVYLRTSSGVYLGNLYGWNKIDALTDRIFTEQIKGNSYKNIFIVGHFGLLTHWNGKSWHRYDQFYTYPQRNGDILYSVWAKQKRVFVVGRSETAKGIVYRGKQ